MGMSVKSYKAERIQLEIEPELKQAFEDKCKVEGCTMAGLIRKWIRVFLLKDSKKAA